MTLYPRLLCGTALFSLLLAASAAAQRVWHAGLEFQAYPTGLIPGVQVERLFGARSALHLRIGYQHIRHGDAGRHDDERGHGWGVTLGCRRFQRQKAAGWFAGLRSDVWFNTIDWTDNPGMPTEIQGTTKITVLQPTVEGGYAFTGKGGWFVAPALAFGYEMNVRTEGSPTGEGFILLAGIRGGVALGGEK